MLLEFCNSPHRVTLLVLINLWALNHLKRNCQYPFINIIFSARFFLCPCSALGCFEASHMVSQRIDNVRLLLLRVNKNQFSAVAADQTEHPSHSTVGWLDRTNESHIYTCTAKNQFTQRVAHTIHISLCSDLAVCIYLNYLLLLMPFKRLPELEHGFPFSIRNGFVPQYNSCYQRERERVDDSFRISNRPVVISDPNEFV